MENHRATFDQSVIDAWAAQLARRRRGIGKWQACLVFVLIALVVSMNFLADPRVALIAFGVAAAALIVLQLSDRATLLCPHCRRSPIARLQRGTAEGADFCAHCHYWLVTPYANSDVARRDA